MVSILFCSKASRSLLYEFGLTDTVDNHGNFVNVPIDAFNHAIDAVRYYVLGKLLGRILKTVKITANDIPY